MALAQARCGRRAMPLRGIGNEAFFCPAMGEVVGRVRDSLFKVRIVAGVTAADTVAQKAQAIAEQVAGALF